jgi:hypothetical protein
LGILSTVVFFFFFFLAFSKLIGPSTLVIMDCVVDSNYGNYYFYSANPIPILDSSWLMLSSLAMVSRDYIVFLLLARGCIPGIIVSAAVKCFWRFRGSVAVFIEPRLDSICAEAYGFTFFIRDINGTLGS